MQKGISLRVWNIEELPSDWFTRQKVNPQYVEELDETVKSIIDKVKMKGDTALVEFALRFEKAKLAAGTLQVRPEEIDEAYKKTASDKVAAIKFMKERITNFQQRLLNLSDISLTNDGISVRTVIRPIESVGCYVPGGQAAYPSTLVMTAVPAKIAGVQRIVVCSPSNSEGEVNPLVLIAADMCGVDEVYKVGGAQAIAALAYGTKTIRPVCKIVGPGNQYVTEAKVLVSKDVAIDMPAGPSEVLILADELADPKLISYDMISQAEHGSDSVAGLITTSSRIAAEVKKYLAKIVPSSERSDKISASLEKYGFIIVCKTTEDMICLANQFAAEHLEVMTENARFLAEKLIAGLILIGPYSPVPLSDYASGTNHVLPTNGFANSFSGLTVSDFLRRVSIVESTKAGLRKVTENLKVLTDSEGLPNHYKAIVARFE